MTANNPYCGPRNRIVVTKISVIKSPLPFINLIHYLQFINFILFNFVKSTLIKFHIYQINFYLIGFFFFFKKNQSYQTPSFNHINQINFIKSFLSSQFQQIVIMNFNFLNFNFYQPHNINFIISISFCHLTQSFISSIFFVNFILSISFYQFHFLNLYGSCGQNL